MMAPSLLLEEGRVRMVLGSGGSKRIRTTLFQVISHVVDFGLTVHEAIEAPRLHWDGEWLQAEPGLPERTRERLGRDWPLNVWEERNLYFGGAHAVDLTGGAHADPRREGGAAVIDVAE
jgi:gamma-glutamyltranspeptidase/glutathione hydrolase